MNRDDLEAIVGFVARTKACLRFHPYPWAKSDGWFRKSCRRIANAHSRSQSPLNLSRFHSKGCSTSHQPQQGSCSFHGRIFLSSGSTFCSPWFLCFVGVTRGADQSLGEAMAGAPAELIARRLNYTARGSRTSRVSEAASPVDEISWAPVRFRMSFARLVQSELSV